MEAQVHEVRGHRATGGPLRRVDDAESDTALTQDGDRSVGEPRGVTRLQRVALPPGRHRREEPREALCVEPETRRQLNEHDSGLRAESRHGVV